MLERMLLYYPVREITDSPASIGLPFQEISVSTEDAIRLHGWYIPCAGAASTILIFHGNAGNIGHRVPWLEMLHRLQVHLLILDYRGYGHSDGEPSEKGLYRDATAAFEWWVRQNRGGQKLIVLGESLGGAVAVNLASRVRVDGLILQSTFTSAWDMAKTILPLGLLQPVIGVRLDSEGLIKGVSCPKLVIHGTRDEIVPFRLGVKLYEAAPPPKSFYEVESAGHNDLIWSAGPEYLVRISAFVSEVENHPESNERRDGKND
jgi:uncharacterized protein